MKVIMLIFVFFFCAVVQMSLINTLPEPFSLLPLHFLVGITVLHRAGYEYGFFWFISSSLILPLLGFEMAYFWTYWIIGVCGAFFSTKVFTTRSVYALIGLGSSLFVIFLFLNWLPKIAVSVFIENQLNNTLKFTEIFISLILLIIGLYLSFIIARSVERVFQKTFILRKKA